MLDRSHIAFFTFILLMLPTYMSAAAESHDDTNIPFCGNIDFSTPLESSTILEVETQGQSYYFELANDVVIIIGEDGTVLDRTSVSQEDYGSTNTLHRGRGDYIFAIGDQYSYYIKYLATQFDARFILNEEVPSLFSKKCTYISRLLGSCQTAGSYFSSELRLLLKSGYTLRGNYLSLAFGLDEIVDLHQQFKEQLDFVGDIAGSGRVAFKSRETGGLFTYDGNEVRRCKRN